MFKNYCVSIHDISLFLYFFRKIYIHAIVIDCYESIVLQPLLPLLQRKMLLVRCVHQSSAIRAGETSSGRCGTEFNEFRYDLQNMVTEGKKHSTLSFISRKKKACSHRDQGNFERIRRQWAKQTTKCNLFIIE